MKLILASNNRGKLREIKEIIGDLGLEVMTKDEAGLGGPSPVEDADSLEGNALIKARALDTDQAVLADDTGLFVRALDGPGVHTARYAGEGATDEANRAKLLNDMEGIEDRSAYFETVIVLLYKGDVYTARGRCHGEILREEAGDLGFGYDSIFKPDGYEESFAQLDPVIKNSISHRSRALEDLKGILEDLGHD